MNQSLLRAKAAESTCQAPASNGANNVTVAAKDPAEKTGNGAQLRLDKRVPPPAFAIASPGSGEGEAMAKAGGGGGSVFT